MGQYPEISIFAKVGSDSPSQQICKGRKMMLLESISFLRGFLYPKSFPHTISDGNKINSNSCFKSLTEVQEWRHALGQLVAGQGGVGLQEHQALIKRKCDLTKT